MPKPEVKSSGAIFLKSVRLHESVTFLSKDSSQITGIDDEKAILCLMGPVIHIINKTDSAKSVTVPLLSVRELKCKDTDIYESISREYKNPKPPSGKATASEGGVEAPKR